MSDPKAKQKIRAYLHSGEVVVPKKVVDSTKAGNMKGIISFIAKARPIDKSDEGRSFLFGSQQSEAERQKARMGNPSNQTQRNYTNQTTGEQMTETTTRHRGDRPGFDLGDLNIFGGERRTTTTQNARGDIVGQSTSQSRQDKAANQQYQDRYRQEQDAGNIRSVQDAPVSASESEWWASQKGIAGYNPELGIGIDAAGNHYRGDGTNKVMVGKRNGPAPQEGSQTRREEHINRDRENPNIHRAANDPRGVRPTAPVNNQTQAPAQSEPGPKQSELTESVDIDKKDTDITHERDPDLERRALLQDIFNSRRKRSNVIKSGSSNVFAGQGQTGPSVETVGSEYDDADFQSARDRTTDRQLEQQKKQYGELDRKKGIDQLDIGLQFDKKKYKELTYPQKLDELGLDIKRMMGSADAQMRIKLQTANKALDILKDPSLSDRDRWVVIQAIGASVPGISDVIGFSIGNSIMN